jgi:hypothetical protein
MHSFLNVSKQLAADSDGHAVYGVSMRLLDSWDRIFEFPAGHGRSQLWFVVCCEGSGFCDNLITCSDESYRVCV